MATDTIRAYVKYREQRKAIQVAQRKQLEEDLVESKVELGRLFQKERAEGARIEDLNEMIGNKNKSFIYEMIYAYKEAERAKESAEKPEHDPNEYTLTDNGNSVFVTFVNDPEETYTVMLHNGEVTDTPEEWLVDTKERKAVYAKIIREIENR